MIEDVEVLPTQSNAPETVRAAGERDAAHEVGAGGTTFALPAVLASNELPAVATVRRVTARVARNAVVTANEPLTVATERARVASRAPVTLHAFLRAVSGLQPAEQLAVPRLKLVNVELGDHTRTLTRKGIESS